MGSIMPFYPTSISDSFVLVIPSTSFSTQIIPHALCVQVSVDEDFAKPLISIYPNPTKSCFTITSREINGGTIEIFTPLGEIIYRFPFHHNSQTINLNHIPGIYFVRVNDEEKFFTQKLVIE